MEGMKRYLPLLFCTLVIGTLALTGAYTAIRDRSVLHITELCIHNETAAYDIYGRYGADYIELFNGTGSEISIAGYGLTDDSRKLAKYVFPEDAVIAPMSTVIVWCSVPDESYILRNDVVRRDFFQEQFQLRAGEHVVLSSPDGSIIDTVSVPEVPDNLSYASSASAPDIYMVSRPSPYRVSLEAEPYETEPEPALSVPSFSVSSGIYADAFFLELYADEGMIFYTLDGSKPDEQSALYTEAILITDRSEEPDLYATMPGQSLVNPYVPDAPVRKGTIVRAVCIGNDGVSKSEEVTAVYFVGMDRWEGFDSLPVISLTANPDDLFGEENGICVTGAVYDNYVSYFEEDGDFVLPANYACEGIGWERPVQIDLFSDAGEHLLSQQAGIRIHGGWSVALNQKSFNLYARTVYDGSELFRYLFLEEMCIR